MFTDNVIKLDYSLSDDELRPLFKELQITEESGFKARKKFDVVFFMLVGDVVKFEPFAFIRKGQKGIEFEKTFYRELAKMDSSTAECAKSVVNADNEADLLGNRSNNLSFEYDVDSILDKILEKGIDSLSKTERQQLDAFTGEDSEDNNSKDTNFKHSTKTQYSDTNQDNFSKKASQKNTSNQNEIDQEALEKLMNVAKAMLKDSPSNKRHWVNKYKNHPLYGIVAGVINGKYDIDEMEKRIVKYLNKRNN